MNPSNWFGSSRSTEVTPTENPTNPLIPAKRNGIFKRPEAEDVSLLIANVTALQVDQTPSGGIISVTGVASRQGAFDTQLRRVEPQLLEDEGILTLEFRVVYPVDATVVGTENTRTIHQAVTLSRQELEKVRIIRVVGSQNVRETRRR